MNKEPMLNHFPQSFPFIATLLITKDILGYTKGLSIKLQGRYVDIVKAYNEVESTKLYKSREWF